MDICKENVLKSNRLEGGGQIDVTHCDDFTNHLYVKRCFLTALDMAKLTKITYLYSLKRKIGF